MHRCGSFVVVGIVTEKCASALHVHAREFLMTTAQEKYANGKRTHAASWKEARPRRINSCVFRPRRVDDGSHTRRGCFRHGAFGDAEEGQWAARCANSSTKD